MQWSAKLVRFTRCNLSLILYFQLALLCTPARERDTAVLSPVLLHPRSKCDAHVLMCNVIVAASCYCLATLVAPGAATCRPSLPQPQAACERVRTKHGTLMHMPKSCVARMYLHAV